MSPTDIPQTSPDFDHTRVIGGLRSKSHLACQRERNQTAGT